MTWHTAVHSLKHMRATSLPLCMKPQETKLTALLAAVQALTLAPAAEMPQETPTAPDPLLLRLVVVWPAPGQAITPRVIQDAEVG